MFRHVQAIEPGFIGGDGEFQPFIELGRQRPVGGSFQMIEKSDFHFIILSYGSSLEERRDFRSCSLADFSWPQAAMISRPRARRTGDV